MWGYTMDDTGLYIFPRGGGCLAGVTEVSVEKYDFTGRDGKTRSGVKMYVWAKNGKLACFRNLRMSQAERARVRELLWLLDIKPGNLVWKQS